MIMADLRPPSLNRAVPQNVDEYFREIYNAVTQLQASVNALTSRNVAITGTDPYTIDNLTTQRSLDADTASIDEVSDTLGTLISDLRRKGILS